MNKRGLDGISSKSSMTSIQKPEDKPVVLGNHDRQQQHGEAQFGHQTQKQQLSVLSGHTVTTHDESDEAGNDDDTDSTTSSKDSEPTPKRVRSNTDLTLQDINGSGHGKGQGQPQSKGKEAAIDIKWQRTVVPSKDNSGVLEILVQDPEDGLPLPNPADDDMNPTDFLVRLVELKWDTTLETKKSFDLEGFFVQSTDEQVAAYTTEIVTAVRTNNLEDLKKLYASGKRVDCFNRFGESLLNMACRRGFNDIVQFLLKDALVALRVRDDCGRTPLHDACWNPSPLLDICKWIIQREPALFLIADKRGFTPFMYARPEHYGIWRQFLFDNRHYLKVLSYEEMKSTLAAAPAQ